MPHTTSYRPAQVILHWVVVVLILVQYIANEPISDAWRALRQTGAADPGPGVLLHVVAGGLVLVLALWRLALRFRYGAPPPPAAEAAPLRLAAGLVHWVLYALILLLPVSGAAAWFGGIEGAADAHEVFKTLLIILTVLHVAAALWHQFWLRDGLMARMRPGR